MDNIDALLSNMTVKKSKVKKDENKLLSNTLGQAASIGFGKTREISTPKSPKFKPQQSPQDMIPEILLPGNELSSEDNDGSDQNSNEIEYYMKKQHFSCPTGPTLNIWVGNGNKNDYGFEMIEENDGDMFNYNDEAEPQIKFNDYKKPNADLMDVIPTTTLSKKASTNNTNADFKRLRSQSENITACTIFKFMEAKPLGQKRAFL